MLQNLNNLHWKLEFTMKRTDGKGNLAFLDMKIKVNSCKNNCEWYKKPTDTGVVSKMRSWAPIQHKKNIIEGTVHHVLRSTSLWQKFDKALKEIKNVRLKNQYPEGWKSRLTNKSMFCLKTFSNWHGSNVKSTMRTKIFQSKLVKRTTHN